jgi:diaminohydroxyphosphoribosylaminopyrimidine deaminase/5-amino-6-(5-phosphoribosylamino)uracil reductase
MMRSVDPWANGQGVFLLPLDESDRNYLERALGLAELGRGLTTPNPIVGAVIVSEGRVVGEGYHTGAGRHHAEIAAIKDAAARSASVSMVGATMYVTLEPCCVYGRTPPCVPALLSAGFTRVVVGAIDPSPQVNGKGLQQLRDGGVQVDLAEDDLATRCKHQNDGFRKTMATGLPFVTYKYAMTLDGRIATDTGDSRWISGAESRLMVHRMRSWTDVVMVGAGTLRADDPTLTAREVECRRQPLRVVVDPHLCITRGAALVRTGEEGPVLVVCGERVSINRRAEVESWGVEVGALPGERPEPSAVASLLAARGAQTVLLEGGATLAGAWWSAGLIDRVVAFVSPRLLSGEVLRSPLEGVGSDTVAASVQLREIEVLSVGADVCVSGYVREVF